MSQRDETLRALVRAAHALNVALAKRILAERNAENAAAGTPNDWPAQQTWDELVHSSHCIFQQAARREAGIDASPAFSELLAKYVDGSTDAALAAPQEAVSCGHCGATSYVPVPHTKKADTPDVAAANTLPQQTGDDTEKKWTDKALRSARALAALEAKVEAEYQAKCAAALAAPQGVVTPEAMFRAINPDLAEQWESVGHHVRAGCTEAAARLNAALVAPDGPTILGIPESRYMDLVRNEPNTSCSVNSGRFDEAEKMTCADADCDYWKPIPQGGIALPCSCGNGCEPLGEKAKQLATLRREAERNDRAAETADAVLTTANGDLYRKEAARLRNLADALAAPQGVVEDRSAADAVALLREAQALLAPHLNESPPAVLAATKALWQNGYNAGAADALELTTAPRPTPDDRIGVSQEEYDAARRAMVTATDSSDAYDLRRLLNRLVVREGA